MRSVAGERPWSDVITRERATLAAEMKTSRTVTEPNAASDVVDDDRGASAGAPVRFLKRTEPSFA